MRFRLLFVLACSILTLGGTSKSANHSLGYRIAGVAYDANDGPDASRCAGVVGQHRRRPCPGSLRDHRTRRRVRV